LKNVLPVKSTVLLIDEMNSGYHLTVRKFHYRLKQDNFQKNRSYEYLPSLLKKICLSSVAFSIVCINKRVTYITNKVLRQVMAMCLNVTLGLI